MVYFTSDLHINHQNILTYERDSRRFDTVEEMNQTIIDNINSVVKQDDILYILGDLLMGQREKAAGWLERIQCRDVTVILGNHDSNQWKQDYYRSLGWRVLDDVVLEYGAFRFFCYHRPIEETGQYLYTKRDIYLYGHVHGKGPKGLQQDNTYHVGLDTNNLKPVSAAQIMKEYNER